MANLYELLSNTADTENETAQNSALYDNLVKAAAANELLSLANQNQTAKTGQTAQTTAKTTPSFLGDLSGGFRENAKAPISLNNFTEKTTPDGNQKGFAYRLGEGLGSLARMIDSPIGRGLIMGGAVLADKNGSPLKALAYGTQVAAANQANRLRDNTYRQQLQEQGINTNNLGNGYLTDTAYKNIIDTANKTKELQIQQKKTDYENELKGLQIREKEITLSTLPEKTKAELLEQNAKAQQAAAKAYYAFDSENANLENTKAGTANLNARTTGQNIENEFRPQKLQNDIDLQNIDKKYKPLKNEADIYNTYDNSRYGRSDFNERKNQNAINNMFQAQKANTQRTGTTDKTTKQKIQDIEAIENQINRFIDSFDDLPAKAEEYTLGNLRKLTGTQTGKEVNFTSQLNLLFNKIARDLGGEKGVLSDQDIKRIENAMPTLYDSKAQKLAKMQAVTDLLNDRKQALGVNTQTTDLKVDKSALEAEMKRRGLL